MRASVFGATGLAIAAVLMAPGSGGAQVPPGDSVTGTVTLFQGSGLGDVPVEIDAHSGPSGEDPTGRMALRFPQFTSPIEGSVGCLRVIGNTAVIGVNFINAGVPGAFFEVVDGAPDELSFSFVSTPVDVSDCPAEARDNPQTITSGDLVVVDAPPLPTSREQCGNGGWRAFGVFKNQGDCVSFVATKGKNPANSP